MIEHEILQSISLNDGKSLSLSGRVDRVDILRENGIEKIKIVDYKSGSAKFSMDDALKGVQLQLMLYMSAIVKSRKNAAPGGVFYFPIDDPIINADEILSDTAREENLFKCFKMSGIETDDEKFNAHAFESFGRDVESKVKELGARIFNGEISAQPYTRGQKSPCNFCKFTGVCGSCLK
jgi:ATP-dependent helicase/nuclease subunit B